MVTPLKKPEVPSTAAERRFYARTRAFGRFGMRLFEPTIMDAPHWHGHVEVNYVRHVRMHYVVDGTKLVVEPDQPVVFWAGIPHQLKDIEAVGTGKPELVNIYLPLDTFLYMKHVAPLQVGLLTGAMVAIDPDIMSWHVLQRWYADYRSGDAARLDMVKTDLHGVFRRTTFAPFTYLRASWLEGSSGEMIASSNVRHVISMLRYVLENIEHPLKIADVTKVTGLHSNYALTIFSKTIRLSLKQFIIRMRLLKARGLLLESDMAITTVAEQSGFNSISQFYAHFSKAYGLSPQQLRQSYYVSA